MDTFLQTLKLNLNYLRNFFENHLRTLKLNFNYLRKFFENHLRTLKLNFNYLRTFCKLGTSFSEFNKYLVNNQHICKSKNKLYGEYNKNKRYCYMIYIYIYIYMG